MASIVQRPQARPDLIDVWTYIAQDDETAADCVLDWIERALAMLVDNPFAGRSRPELADDLRSFPVGDYVLFYIPTGNGIDVIRVLNGYRDIGAEEIEV